MSSIFLAIEIIRIIDEFRAENRFHILIGECLCLGFLVGFVSSYFYFPSILVVLLSIHIFGTLYSEKGFHRLIQLILYTPRRLIHSLSQISVHRSTNKSTKKPKTIPQKYLYNYHLKPTNDLRLQHV